MKIAGRFGTEILAGLWKCTSVNEIIGTEYRFTDRDDSYSNARETYNERKNETPASLEAHTVHSVYVGGQEPVVDDGVHEICEPYMISTR